MAVYAISDLHLALSIDKPMDIFGARWSNYMERLKSAWESIVSNEDYVVVPGDISWATYLEQAYEDFRYIEALPGRKIISKGNHDYWWTTLSKLEKFLAENSFTSISFMHNNGFILDGIGLCGTRGWKCPGDDDFGSEDRKIYERELQRLELSLKSIHGGSGHETVREIIVAMHYPPFGSGRETSGFVDIMAGYGVKTCVYGHLHNEGFRKAVTGNICGIDFRLVSADYLEFRPLKLV